MRIRHGSKLACFGYRRPHFMGFEMCQDYANCLALKQLQFSSSCAEGQRGAPRASSNTHDNSRLAGKAHQTIVKPSGLTTTFFFQQVLGRTIQTMRLAPSRCNSPGNVSNVGARFARVRS